ncbi:Vault protein inter-alpha-trypsin domain [Pelomyxa schiedti]|nr:Vault protein inter-alpha-trypsin domain [Pelomyxa schiedti]
MEEALRRFEEIAACDRPTAHKYLRRANNDVNRAIALYFDETHSAPPIPSVSTQHSSNSTNTAPPTSSPIIGTTTSAPTRTAELDYSRPFGAVFTSRERGTSGDRGERPSRDKATPNPFASLRVVSTIMGVAADVSMTHTFVNREDFPIEAVFAFAQGEFSVYELEVNVGGRIIKGSVQEKQAAANKYDDAIASGNGAYVLENEIDNLQGSMLKMQIGNLPSRSSAIVTLRYITELQYEQGRLRFELPNTHCLPASTEEAGFSFSCEVEAPAPILSIHHSHTIDSAGEGAMSKITSTVKEISDTFWLEFELNRTVDPLFITIEEDEDSSKVAMVSLFPNINTEQDACSELIFLVDRSGSMAGSRINQVKNAMQLFLRSIPSTCLFNIIGFGSRFEKLFPQSTQYSEDSFSTAKAYVLSMRASLGGTEVLPPLQDIFSQQPRPDFPRQIFFLTDGDVKNTNDVISFVKNNNSGGTRIFSFGISAEASPHLVRGIATATRGKAEFITTDTRIEPKVMSQIKRALQPILKNVAIDWGTIAAKQTPTTLPPIFDNERMLVYGFLSNTENISTSVCRVRAFLTEELTFPFQLNLSKTQHGKLVHRLAFRSVIHDLENAEKKQEAIDLSVKYQLESKYTSFICVESRSEAVQEPMQLRVVEPSTRARVPPPCPFPRDQPGSAPIWGGSKSRYDDSRRCRDTRPERQYGGARHDERSHDWRNSRDRLDGSRSYGRGGYSRAEETTHSYNSRRGGDRRENLYSGYGGRDRDFDEYSQGRQSFRERDGDGDRGFHRDGGGERGAYRDRDRDRDRERDQDRSSYRDDRRTAPGSERNRDSTMAEVDGRQPERERRERQREMEESDLRSDIKCDDRHSERYMPVTDRTERKKRMEEYTNQPRPNDRPSRASENQLTLTPSASTDYQDNSQVRPLDKLIFLQNSDGSWLEFNEAVLTIIGCALELIQRSVPPEIQSLKNCQSIWNTAIALVCLQSKFTTAIDEWEMLALKAKKWLSQQLSSSNCTITTTALLEAAQKIVPTNNST